MRAFSVCMSLIMAVLFCPLISGCSEQDKNIIYVTQFPQYDFAKTIGGEEYTVRMMLPPGTDGHSYEPTPRDVAGAANAKMFIYSGQAADGWSQQVYRTIQKYGALMVDVSQGIELMSEEEHGHEEHDHEHREDAHYWLDLSNAAIMVDTVADAFCRIDGDKSQEYLTRAAGLKASLAALDARIHEYAETVKGKSLVFGGKFAYIYFLCGYGFDYLTAYDSCESEVEPPLSRVAFIADFAKSNRVPYIFSEEYSSGGVAHSVALHAGAQVLPFHTCHNLSRSDFIRGATFLELMQTNFDNAKRALAYGDN